MAKVYALNTLLLSASRGEPTNHLRRARNKASSLKMTKRCLPAFFVQTQEVVDYTTRRNTGRAPGLLTALLLEVLEHPQQRLLLREEEA